MDGFDEELKEMKSKQREIKKKLKGTERNKDGQEEITKVTQMRHGSSVSSSEAEAIGLRSSISSGGVNEILESGQGGS